MNIRLTNPQHREIEWTPEQVVFVQEISRLRAERYNWPYISAVLCLGSNTIQYRLSRMGVFIEKHTGRILWSSTREPVELPVAA